MALPYLYEHENRHAPRRANGRRFHGYPTRQQRTDLVVVHDTESMLDTVGLDTGALVVAGFQASTDRPSSYHRITDSARTVLMLPDEATAFGAKGANGRGLHVSLAMRVVDWRDTRAIARVRRDLAVERTAQVVAEWCKRYRIPVRRITRAQFLAGVAGIVAHADVDPGRRSDPGPLFPWDAFLTRVRELVDGSTAPPVLITDPEVPTMRVVHRPDGLTVLLTDSGRFDALEPGEADALRAAGIPVEGVTAAQFGKLEGIARLLRTGKRTA